MVRDSDIAALCYIVSTACIIICSLLIKQQLCLMLLTVPVRIKVGTAVLGWHS